MSDFAVDAIGPYIVVAPTDSRDYSFDWTAVLAGLPAIAGSPPDQLVRSTWSVPLPNIAGATALNIPSNIATVWISTPTIGEYVVLNTVNTLNGRQFTRGFRLIVAENI